MATVNEIKSNAQLVKNATEIGENTAPRVGGVLVDMADHLPETIEQATGTSTTSVMSQKAVTDALAGKVDNADIAQELGGSENAVMSQKAVKDAILNKIDLSAIDFDSGTLVKLAMCQTPTRFNVVKNNKSCGTMEVFSDDMGHMVTEVFDTHYTLVDGELGTTHLDDKIFRYMRSYHLVEGGTSDIPVGTWGEWKQVYSSDNQNDIDTLKEDVSNLNANTGLDEYETFSDQKAYSAGDVVNYNGLLYQFTSDHVAGAWTGSDAEETNIINIASWQIKLAGANDILNTFVKGSAADIFKNEKTYITGTGVIGQTQNANYYTTDYIPLDIAKNWVIKGTGYNSKYPTVVFYNEAFAPLDTYFLKSAEHDLVITDDILSLYPETKYVIYASYDKDLAFISVENNINSLAENIATNAENIENLSNEVIQNTDNVTDLSGKVNSFEISTIGNLLYGVEVTQGYYLGGGEPIVSEGWSISPFVEVEANQEYIYKNIKRSTGFDFFYDKDKNLISSISYVDIEEDANNLHKYTTPENCKYVRLSFNTRTPNLTNNIYLVRSDGLDYALEGKKTIINANMRIDNVIGYSKNKMTHNLLDVNKIVRDTYLVGFNEVLANKAGWSTTPIIRVKQNTKYALLSGDNFQIITPQFSFYGNKYFTKIGAIASDEDGTFTTPEDCAYVQLSIQNFSDKLILQEVDENGKYYYIPYGLEAENQDIIHSPFLGKKICVVGDSTTEGGQWMIDVAQNLGMWLYVNAIGGTTVAYNESMGSETTSMCTDTRINAIPEDADIIVFAGGLNDWSQAGIPLGTLEGEHMHDTFYGAYQLMLDKAFARCPNARFVLAELTYRHQGTANPQGATMMDYRNAVRAIAEKYCYPILPMYKNAGINAANYTQFARDEGDMVHHNDLGNRRLGRVATAAMLAMV